MVQTHGVKMTCPDCATTPVGGHCTRCLVRLPVPLDDLVSCGFCNRLAPRAAQWCPGCLSARFQGPRAEPAPVSLPPDSVWEFTRHPSPGGSRGYDRYWKKRALALGPGAPVTLRQILREGSIDEQEGALLGLRVHGYETFARGLARITEYRVRAPGSDTFERIEPLRLA